MGAWISLVDYAHKHQISLSTLRRYIKSGKLSFRKEDGRYLILDDQATHVPLQIEPQRRLAIENTHHPLERQLLQAHEEIAELKTLVALYEEKMQLNAKNL